MNLPIANEPNATKLEEHDFTCSISFVSIHPITAPIRPDKIYMHMALPLKSKSQLTLYHSHMVCIL